MIDIVTLQDPFVLEKMKNFIDRENLEGKKIAEKCKLDFNGYWINLRLFVFTDSVTKLSFSAVSEFEVLEKLKKIRQ
jgi:hypothetical protein